MNLVIVESPTKARKLSGYLGNDFTVRASVGHVRDLPKKKLGVDVENNFEPQYVTDRNKSKVINELKDLAKKADQVVLAMDPDREGEAIAWHVQYLLENDKTKKTKDDFLRATFHEITKKAVLDAIAHPSQLKMHLVNAQQARRIVDRLVGYKVSPVLWKKVRWGLSAGRVQSVALRLIVEREREIEAFVPDEYWEIDALLSPNQKLDLTKELTQTEEKNQPKPWIKEVPTDGLVARVIEVNNGKYNPESEKDVTGILVFLKKATYQASEVEKKQRLRNSLPPFTTSTLQQNAATRLGFTSKQTMTLAQQLYEEGLITYHRTDSVNLSTQAIEMARDYVGQTFGKNYLPSKPRVFQSKSKNAQEAHEAIRVTDVGVTQEQIAAKAKRLSPRHAKLYDLIWRRHLASQMKAATYDQTSIVITAQGAVADAKTGDNKAIKTATLRSSGSILKFDGWMKLFPGGGDTLLPDIEKGQDLFEQDLSSAQKFTSPPPRYNDASLVKELEKKGIGRPSTYASIISVIEDRGYVTRDQKRFKATPIGKTVSDFLMKYFETIMDYDFTAEMEEDLDRVARGEKDWRKIVGDFYNPLEKKIDKVIDKAERMQIPVEKTGEQCPDCLAKQKAGELEGEVGEIVIRTGKFGKFKSCSKYPDCKFTENIVETVDDVVCPLCQQGDVIIKTSRWGKQFYGCSRYPECDWANWKQPEKGEKITKAEWAEIKKAREERKKKRAARAEANGQGKSKTKTASKKKTTKAKKTKSGSKAKKTSKK